MVACAHFTHILKKLGGGGDGNVKIHVRYHREHIQLFQLEKRINHNFSEQFLSSLT